MSKKIKAFVFDFDNTLLPSDELVVRSFFKGYEKVTGKKASIEEVISHYGPDEKGVFYGILNDKEKAEEAFIVYLEEYKKLQSTLFKDGFNKKYYSILKNIKEEGFKIIVLTGRSRESSILSLDYFGLSNLIDGLYSGSFYGVNKSDSFKKLFKDFSLSNEEVIYFGDTLNDIKSCKEVNVNICSVTMYIDRKNAEILKENNKYRVVSSLDELNDFIKNLIKENK